jgi:Mg2+/Co2+ transporter CorB
MIVTLLVIVLLIVLAAVFCAAETAMLSASKARLYQKARSGHRRAIAVLDMLKHPDQFLATILIILTLVPVVTSALTTSLFHEIFGHLGVMLATVMLAVSILLFGEAFPKALGTRYPESIALTLAPMMVRVVRLLGPVTRAIKALNNSILWALGLRHTHSPHYSETDIRGAINLGLEHGVLAPTQHRMLDAVLDLNDLTVRDVMVHRSAIAGLDVNTLPADLPRALGDLKHSRVVVYDGTPDTLLGILYVRDYLTALAGVASRHDVTLRQLLRPLYFVPETTPIGHQMREFLTLHRHLALVVDEFGDLQGLVTLEDILEEIVGDIADEHDAARAATLCDDGGTPPPEGGAIYAGHTPVRDLNRRMGWTLPDDSAVTLAGLMTETLGHLPAQGEHCHVAGLTLTVATKRGHRLEKILIVPHESQ